MNENGLISLVAMVGWLVLALGSYRAHRVGARKTIVMALGWGAVFGLVFTVFWSVGG